MISIRPLLGFAGASLMIGLLSGCGTPSYPVRGTVVFPDGKPLPGGTVVFELNKEDIRERLTYASELDAEGKFATKLPAGKYRVSLAPATVKEGGVEGSERIWKFDPRFGSVETAKLEFTVTSDASKNDFKIQVTPPPAQ